MSRYQNNFKFYQRVQTHQFTEPRRLVQNTIGSLGANNVQEFMISQGFMLVYMEQNCWAHKIITSIDNPALNLSH